MRRLVVALLAVSCACTFLAAYADEDAREYRRVAEVGEACIQPFAIPSSPLLAEPQDAYALIARAAESAHVNILRMSVGYTREEREEVVRYVLLTGETRLFDGLRLESGRLLTVEDMQIESAFLSTEITGERGQVGVLREFGGDDLISIRHLAACYEDLPVEGSYYVESTSDEAYSAFVTAFVAGADERFGEGSFTARDFEPLADPAGTWVSGPDVMGIVAYLVLVAASLVLVYGVLHDAKRIGVMKLHGVSSVRIWFSIAGRPVTAVFISCAVLMLLGTAVVVDTTWHFASVVLVRVLTAYAAALVVSVIAVACVLTVRVSDVVKNRRPVKGIFMLNTFLKVSCAASLVLAGVIVWSSYGAIADARVALRGWEGTRDYGVFYPLNVGHDQEDLEHGLVSQTKTEVFDLYPSLNEAGAVFVETRFYDTAALFSDGGAQSAQAMMKVNPNYLAQYPILDAQGIPVFVSEEESDLVILASEEYRENERAILRHFTEERRGHDGVKGLYEVEESMFGTDVPYSVRSQEVRIIWLAANQTVFAFDPAVFPENGNVVDDPIIQVVTTANRIGLDLANMVNGMGGSDPLKVRLIDGDTDVTLRALEPVLERTRLDDNIVHLVTVDQYMLMEIHGIEKELRTVALAGLGLAVGLILLLVQNVAILFKKYERVFVVRGLFGAGPARKYKECWLVLGATGLSELLACLAAVASGLLPLSPVGLTGTVLAAAIVVALIELIASFLTVAAMERRHGAMTLKVAG